MAPCFVLSGLHALFKFGKGRFLEVRSGLQTNPYKVGTVCPGMLK